MAKKDKNYCVVLFESGLPELEPVLKTWLRNSDMGHYIYAKSIDPSGPYFHMVVDTSLPGGPQIDFELQLPHVFIKAIFYAADVKALGFS